MKVVTVMIVMMMMPMKMMNKSDNDNHLDEVVRDSVFSALERKSGV